MSDRLIVPAALVAFVLSTGGPAFGAAPDACTPTSADDPLAALVDRLNDPDAGAALRAKWSIDRAVWVKPNCATDASGALRLVAPAHADIHASMATAGAVWDPEGGNPQTALVDANKAPSGIRLLIPRHYADEPTRRLITREPQGPLDEYTGDPFSTFFKDPLLRKGFLAVNHNSVYPTVQETPNSLQELGKRTNQATRFALDLLADVGVPAPHYVYAEGQSRGSQVLAWSIESAGTPFDGVLLERGGGAMAPRAREVPGFVRALRAANPADAAAMDEYFAAIGRLMTITRSDGTTRTGIVSATLDADLRFHFGLPATAQTVFPEVPPFDRYPSITYRFTGLNVDNLIQGRAGARAVAPGTFRNVLADVDPEYLADIDAGAALLRDWDPDRRPRPVGNALERIEVSGEIQTRVLKIHGTRDPDIFPTLHIDYVDKVIAQGRGDLIRNYMIPGGVHANATAVETFVAASGASVSLGRKLDHLDALVAWVEGGAEPGDLTVANPRIPNASLVIKGAHQLGFQNDPTAYFEKQEGLR